MKKSSNIFLLYLLLLTSCLNPINREVKQKFINRFDYNNNIDSLINIDGFYQMQYLYSKELKDGTFIIDTNCKNLIFFKDGTVFLSFNCNKNEYKNKFINSIDTNCLYGYGATYKGIYRIVSGDIIIAQYLSYPSYMSSINFFEDWYMIEDKNTLKYINTRYLLSIDKIISKEHLSDYVNQFSLAKFNKVVMPPLPNSWMKEQKWLWKNEKDWENYMVRIKNIKSKQK